MKRNSYIILSTILAALLLTFPSCKESKSQSITPGNNDPSLTKISVENSGTIFTRFQKAVTNKDSNPKPLIFFIGGSEGGIFPSDSKYILDLQNHGYNVVTVGYFGMEELPDTLTKIDLEPFGKAIRVYKNYEGVDPERIGIIGGSKGGELALLLGSFYNTIHMVIGIVPAHVSFQGLKFSLFHHSSWQFKGEELPFVPYSNISVDTIKNAFQYLSKSKAAEASYLQTHLTALKNKKAEENARIMVEKINGPILLLSAKHDQFWPSSYMSEEIVKRLADNNFSYNYKHIEYDSNHFILENPEVWDTILCFIEDNI